MSLPNPNSICNLGDAMLAYLAATDRLEGVLTELFSPDMAATIIRPLEAATTDVWASIDKDLKAHSRFPMLRVEDR